jgi:hypothetical protein
VSKRTAVEEKSLELRVGSREERRKSEHTMKAQTSEKRLAAPCQKCATRPRNSRALRWMQKELQKERMGGLEETAGRAGNWWSNTFLSLEMQPALYCS